MNKLTGFSRLYGPIALLLAIVAISYIILAPVQTAHAIVYNEAGLPIEGALVRLVAYPQYNDLTDSNGEYIIPEVPEGTYFITASKEGYTTNLSSVTVTGGATVTKDFTLTPGYNWYFAEGSIGDSTDAYVQLSNPGDTPVNVDVRFMLLTGTVVTNSSVLPANSTRVVDAKQQGLPADALFAINVLSDKKIAAERTMVFSALNWGGYIVDDVHDTVGATELNTTWYFAEGSISPDTVAYVQILNPNHIQANVTVQYMMTNGDVITTSKVVTATSRDYFYPGDVLPATSLFSLKVTSDIPIMTERTMVFVNKNWGGQIINGLHDTIGSTELSNTWYFAEGSINAQTWAYVQILNPNPSDATVTVQYMKTTGEIVTTSKVVRATSRDYFDPKAVLPATSLFSIKVTSTLPIMSERTMVFANLNWGGKIINGFHDTIGSTKLSNTWSLGGGYTATDVVSFVQILNPNAQAAHLNVKFMLTDGTVIPYTKTVAANSRDYIDVGSVLGPSRYGWYSVQVTSLDQPIFIEKTEVWIGVTWHGRYIDGFGDTVGSIV
ncbi:MAG: carboxypeptidase-like regulatory domain-containing protein [Candidatus Methanoperedens sp.]|nr:carboxypeptidase-like regulatory domain-containing protein [Candidatus Methanoperedens sp.]